MPSVGIALGSGGARGLAHIAVLEVLDDLGIRPSAVAGTSIGAIIGAMYAAGMTAAEVREGVDELIAMPRNFEQFRKSKRSFGWLELLAIEFGRSHLLQADGFLSEIESLIRISDFSELAIPLQVVATDFWAREPVVFESGPLIPAVEASFCLPGIFRPVVIDHRVLVDGGIVNPVPFDLLRDQCDIVIAVDVLGFREPEDDLLPNYTEALFNTFQIAAKTIVDQKLKSHPPDILVEPAIHDVRTLEFQKAEQIYRESQSECARLASELRKRLEVKA
jgi:NTE family protein